VKIRQNPPNQIGQIRQKSARNWYEFRPFFTLGVVFVGFFRADFALSQEWPRKNIYLIWKYFFPFFLFFENILHKIIFHKIHFLGKKEKKQSYFLLLETPKPPGATFTNWGFF
jgi:hypothetical protein